MILTQQPLHVLQNSNNSPVIARVINAFKFQFIVEYAQCSYIACSKNKQKYLVGDYVHIEIINTNQARILSIAIRDKLIMRQSGNKSKMIASNVNQILIVVACQMPFDSFLLDSSILFAEYHDIRPIIIINKIDMQDDQLMRSLEYYYQLGYITIKLSAIDCCQSLMPLLTNQTSILMGKSGVGKSTITQQLTGRDIKTATKNSIRGQHITTNSSLYHVYAENKIIGDIIDCPGFESFGLDHIPRNSFINCFPELRALNTKCKFSNCTHQHEPDCAILNAYNDKKITRSRLKFLYHINATI